MSVQVQLRRDSYANIMAQSSPGKAGEVFVDTTNQRLVVNDGSLVGGFPAPVVLSAQSNGNTNNSSSGSGSFFTHNLQYTIPANFLIKNRILRVSATLLHAAGSSPPLFTQQFSLGGAGLGYPALNSQQANQSAMQSGVQYLLTATAAPSASSQVVCSAVGNATVWAYAESITGPQNFATNGPLTLTFQTYFATAGTGTNTAQLTMFIVEALN